MTLRRVLLALGAGAWVAVLVLWAFFATLLPVPALEVSHPWRGVIPFLAVFLAGWGIGRTQNGTGSRLGLLLGFPGALVGGVLGLLTALRPLHLVLLVLLVAAFVASAVASVRLGGRQTVPPRR